MHRWPNWIRRGATDSEILDSSSRRCTSKKIISLKTDAFDICENFRIEQYQRKLGLFSYSLEEKKELNKTLLQTELEKITKNYDGYIKKEIMGDGSTFGEDKIINTVKKKYFENNINA